MLESGWLFTGALAVLATTAALLVSDDGLAIVTGTGGVVTWGVWTYGTINVEVVAHHNNHIHTFAMPELTLLGIMMALLPAYIALTGPVELVARASSNTRPEDV